MFGTMNKKDRVFYALLQLMKKNDGRDGGMDV